MSVPFKLEHVIEKLTAGHEESRRRVLKRMTGLKLSDLEAHIVWPRILDHKWYLSERLGRDVGLRVAAVDYFENIQPLKEPASKWAINRGELMPRLPMMLSLGERP
jgi:transitional endoplasmic reticulum ATPase